MARKKRPTRKPYLYSYRVKGYTVVRGGKRIKVKGYTRTSPRPR